MFKIMNTCAMRSERVLLKILNTLGWGWAEAHPTGRLKKMLRTLSGHRPNLQNALGVVNTPIATHAGAHGTPCAHPSGPNKLGVAKKYPKLVRV